MAADSDSRKRTLEALEKRLALSKAQISDKEKPKKITPQRRPKLSRPHPHHPPSASPNAHKPNPKLKPPPSLTPNKGNVNFSGYYFFKEIEEDDPTYAELPHDVNENLLTTNDKSCTDRKSSVESILHELFSKGDNAKKYMHGAKSYTIDNMILLDNVVQGSSRTSGSQARALQIHSKRSKKHMSMKQHKKNGSLDLPQEFHKFDLFKPMQEMWNDYILKLLKPSRNNQLVLCLLGADLHGAFILDVCCWLILSNRRSI
ncbi:hypothetical protein PIB30_117341 [Stylosanthes scabra]|uniref:Uncharacterized protein n=1 Tax=Stylosanthes scabra TaxID=79078 RepID=A0ABU6SEA7_9FABA|nr:hypothetical protein [Stylosanthes scabra]